MRRGVKQHDIRDCGAACLATVCLEYGSKIPLVKIRQMLKVDKNGSSLYAMKMTAEKLDFISEALEGDWAELQKMVYSGELILPAIAHVMLEDCLGHFIVIRNVSENVVSVFDPSKGNAKYSIDEFCELWTGYILSLYPAEGYKPINLKRGIYRKYLRILNMQKEVFAYTVLLSLILAGLSILSSVMYQKWIDEYVLDNGGSIGDILGISTLADSLSLLLGNIDRMAMLLAGLIISEMIILLLRGFALARITKRSCVILMQEYYKHTLNLPLEFFQDRDTGEILSRYQDIGEMQSLLAGVGLSAILDTIMAIAGGYILFSINRILFLMTLTMAVLYSVTVLIYKRPIAEINRDVMENEAKVTSTLKEAFDGIETIKCVQGENKYYEKITQKTEIFMNNILKRNMMGICQSGLLYIVGGIGSLLILWIGSHMVIAGQLSLGTLIAFESLMNFFIAPVQSLAELQSSIQQTVIVAERLNDVFDVPEESFNKINNIKLHEEVREKNDSNSIIILRDITFAYGYTEPVLRKLNFDIKRGEKVAVLGESGCGKTTLARLIASLYEAAEGEIIIDGKSMRNIPLKELRGKIAYVNQNSALFSGSIEDNLLLGINNVKRDRFQAVLEGCHINEILNNLPAGIKTNIGENGKNLSGGQRQRIALARALLRDPEVLILDEATSNIDEKTEKEVINYVLTDRKMTCVVISHNSLVQTKCNRTIILAEPIKQ